MKRVLLTGATGFIGRCAIAPFLARGYEVHAVSSKQANASPDVYWHRADLLDRSASCRLMAEIRPAYLLHFAWYAEPIQFWHSPENFLWLEASIALLRHFREAGGHRIVMAGTCAEYDWEYGYCSENITPCRPKTPYGVCKKSLQEVLNTYCAELKLSGAWGRTFYVFGKNEHPTRLVSSVITSLLRGETAQCANGDLLRDYMYVEDVASAFVALLDSTVEGPVNIATGRPVALRDLVFVAADYLGVRGKIQFGETLTSKNEVPLLVGDNRRLSEEVGWRQQHDIEIRMKQTVDWWKSYYVKGK